VAGDRQCAGRRLIHLLKLAVGVLDVAHLAEIQKRRAEEYPPLRHRTRMMPKRRAEIIDGGSIYWVIGGAILVRQRVSDIIEDSWEDASRCAGILLDPELIRVEARSKNPFQGWRYLSPDDAPADLASAETGGGEAMPEKMRRALAELALLP